MSEYWTGQNAGVLRRNSPTSDSYKKLSDIRMVMIGCKDPGTRRGSGKSSAGNIILGRNAFDVDRRTAQSVQATAHVHGRQVTVVDTPSWWWHYPVDKTPQFDILEIMKSPALCPPGPHVFLLLIPLNSSIHTMYGIMKHLEYFFKNVWRQTIILFSSFDEKNDDDGILSIFKTRPDFQQLLMKCQNRYHVLNIKNQDNSQVIALLEKLEEMVAQNKGQYFEIRRSVSAWNERERETKERANQRLLNVKKRRDELQARIRDKQQHLMDIRIVILGAHFYASSSAGNIILGRNVFNSNAFRTTLRCEVGHAEVHGKQLSVVDTPGWFYDHQKTPEIDKLEIKRSAYLCPPGPHVILLTVPIDTAFNKLIVEEHLGPFGENIWRHTMVLFTWGDWLSDTTIEERIETEGEQLQWLIEQCGHRYHVFDCTKHTDSTQVIELLEKIEEMAMENNGHHFVPEMNSSPSIDYDLKMDKAETNLLKVSRQRNILQELIKDKSYNLSEVRTVLIGGKGVGKSMLGNVILQGNYFESSLDENYIIQTTQCVMKRRQIEGCQVSVVDTPGWSSSTMETPEELLRSVTVCSPGPHAFLLVLPVLGLFMKTSQQTVEELMSLFGENVWRHTIIVFINALRWLGDRPVEEYIACEGEALQELVRKCGNRYHVLVNDWSNRARVRDLLKMIEQTVARNRGEHFTLEKNIRNPKATMLGKSKTLTEEEWNKREDELIEKMLNAAVVDLDTENFKKSFPRKQRSFDQPIPSMSGESFSDRSSLSGHTLNPVSKVFQWLQHRFHARSSGYDTMSITSSSTFADMKGDSNDIPMPIARP